jgi:hypothetical protein
VVTVKRNFPYTSGQQAAGSSVICETRGEMRNDKCV